MTDSFALSIGQAQQLEFAFQRNGWTAADVHRLCQGEVLASVKEFLNQKPNPSLFLIEDVFTPERCMELGFKPGLRHTIQHLSADWNKQYAEYSVTLGDLTRLTRKDLLRMPTMGNKKVDLIEAVLAQYGLALKKATT